MDFKDVLKSPTLDKKQLQMGLSQNGVPHSNQWLISNITHEHSFFGGILHFQTRRHITHVVGILYPILLMCFSTFPHEFHMFINETPTFDGDYSHYCSPC